jgi:hypothetical protein
MRLISNANGKSELARQVFGFPCEMPNIARLRTDKQSKEIKAPLRLLN